MARARVITFPVAAPRRRPAVPPDDLVPERRSTRRAMMVAALVSVAVHAAVAVLAVRALRPLAAPPELFAVALLDGAPGRTPGPPEPEPATDARTGAAEVVPPLVTQPTPPVPPPPRRPMRSRKRPAPAAPPQATTGSETATAPTAADATTGTRASTGVGVAGGAGGEPIPASVLPVPPVVLDRVLPDYPAEARRRRIEGLVVLEAILDRAGRIEDGSLRVRRSPPLLDDAALAAVRRWRFSPGRDQTGTAVRVRLEIPVRFVLR
jgi:protein TonB